VDLSPRLLNSSHNRPFLSGLSWAGRFSVSSTAGLDCFTPLLVMNRFDLPVNFS